ncbi:MAG: hypothetical protein ABIZ80_22815, partial [Bryobacteraceae bacterium]
ERNRRSEQLAADMIERRKPASMWKEYLLEYGEVDFAALRVQLNAESEASARYLAGIESLQVETAKVAALASILGALVKPKSLAAQAGELGTFTKEASTDLTELICAGSKTDLAAKTAARKVVDAAVADLTAQSRTQAVKEELDRRKKVQAKLAAEIKSLGTLRGLKKCPS